MADFLRYVGALFSIEVLLLGAWTAVAPPFYRRVLVKQSTCHTHTGHTDRENTPDTGTHTRTTRPPNEHLPQALNNAQRWRDDGACECSIPSTTTTVCSLRTLTPPLTLTTAMQIAAAYSGDELRAQGATVPPDPYSLD